MSFGKRLRTLREENNLTQRALADKLAITPRTLQNYESEKMYPKNSVIYRQLATIFGVSVDYLLGGEASKEKAREKKSEKEIRELVEDVGGLFAGGELSDEDKDKVMKTITDLYWRAKENNKKYSGNKE